MTDDIDHQYELVQVNPMRNGYCPVCGMLMRGFAKCPFCGGKRKVVRREKLYVGGKEVTR